MLYTGRLGGEADHRGFFGGARNIPRTVGLIASFLCLIVVTPIAGLWGLAGGVGILLLTLLLTLDTHRGSMLDRWTARKRWRDRERCGTVAFEPWTQERADELSAQVTAARGRRAKRDARRQLARLRALPDGLDGVGWLQSAHAMPGIAWHEPVGEPAYLSVTWAVRGQLAGVESEARTRAAAKALGEALEAWTPVTKLVEQVQITTRVLPSDHALHAQWAYDHLDPAAPPQAVKAYAEVLDEAIRDAMVTTHYVTLSWPLTARFRSAASRYGRGRDAWRALMAHEIADAQRILRTAGLGSVEVLTARRLTALIHHQQAPHRAILDMTRANPAALGLPSQDTKGSHIVTDTDTPDSPEWHHRTAALRGAYMTPGTRTQLWMLPLIIGRTLRCHRTVAIHEHLVPRAEALQLAKSDVVADSANVLADRERGRLTDDATETTLSAAQIRRRDLSAGNQHHGLSWVIYITLSETDPTALDRACRELTDVCTTDLGVTRLEWLDSYQAAAMGTTMPVGRGLAPYTPATSARFLRALAGSEDAA